MIRRAALAVAALTFGLSTAALLGADTQGRGGRRPRVDNRPYLNPVGVTITPNGRRAYVVLGGTDELAEVDLATGQVVSRTRTGRHPQELFRNGWTLLVADEEPQYLRIDLATGTTVREGASRFWDGSIRKRAAVEIPPAGRPGSFGLHVAAEPDWADRTEWRVTNHVFQNVVELTHPYDSTLAASGTARFHGALGFAGGNTGDVPRRLTGRLDTDRVGAADPSDAVWSAPAQMAFVAAAGSDAVLALGTKPLRAAVNDVVERPDQPPVQFGFGWGSGFSKPGLRVTFQNRAPTVLKTQSTPRRLALSDDGRILVASNTLSDSLTVIAVDATGPRVVKHIPLGGPPATAARRGEILFHSSRMTFNGRFSCASCHPGGGSDGRVWDTPAEDPSPRRTK